MLMPSIFGENMFDEFFRDPFFDNRDMKKLEKKNIWTQRQKPDENRYP